MTTNLILDIGNVICEWHPERLVASAVSDPAQREAARAAVIGHPDWLELDRGTMELGEAINRAQARSDAPAAEVAAIYANLPGSLTLLEDTSKAMFDASASGMPIYILSNMSAAAWAYLQEHHECFSLCRGVVVSCEAGCIKPEPAIYQHLCDSFSLQPAECLFIDDMAENIAAAKQYGLRGVQLTDPQSGGALIREIVRGVEPDEPFPVS